MKHDNAKTVWLVWATSIAGAALIAAMSCDGTTASVTQDSSPEDALDFGTSQAELFVTPSAPAPFDVLLFSRKAPFAVVRGTAGQLRPAATSNHIFAYVFVTNNGAFAVASHAIEDSTEVGNDLNWHAHRVTLNASNCITALEETGDALLLGPVVGVLNSGATSVSTVLTVVLAPTANGICVIKVHDSLTL